MLHSSCTVRSFGQRHLKSTRPHSSDCHPDRKRSVHPLKSTLWANAMICICLRDSAAAQHKLGGDNSVKALVRRYVSDQFTHVFTLAIVIARWRGPAVCWLAGRYYRLASLQLITDRFAVISVHAIWHLKWLLATGHERCLLYDRRIIDITALALPWITLRHRFAAHLAFTPGESVGSPARLAALPLGYCTQRHWLINLFTGVYTIIGTVDSRSVGAVCGPWSSYVVCF